MYFITNNNVFLCETGVYLLTESINKKPIINYYLVVYFIMEFYFALQYYRHELHYNNHFKQYAKNKECHQKNQVTY